MAAPIVESATWTTTVNMPVDGEVADPDDFLVSTIQPLVNRSRFTKNSIPGLNPTPARRYLNLVSAVAETDPDFCAWEPVRANYPYVKTNSGAGSGALVVEISDLLPITGKVVGIHAQLKGASGHSVLPAVMPVLSLVRMTYNSEPGGGSPFTTLEEFPDGSASYGAYELAHDVGGTVDVTPNLSGYRYFVKLTDEAGAGAVVGLGCHYIYLEIGE